MFVLLLLKHWESESPKRLTEIQIPGPHCQRKSGWGWESACISHSDGFITRLPEDADA